MSTAGLRNFLQATLGDVANQWSTSGVAQVALLMAPETLLGRRSTLLRADAHALWAKWFIESVCDPEPFVEQNPGYGIVFERVLPFARRLSFDATEEEIRLLASNLATFVLAEAQRRSEMRRVRMNLKMRHELLDISGANPRCWACGYLFPEWVIDRFLGENRHEAPTSLPAFLDYAKPQGLIARDLLIEVDHVVPVARGGREGDNLQLACGWCNSAKSAHTAIYDVSGIAERFQHPRLGRLTIPRPFWVVRTLALFGRCEWPGPGGCSRTTMDSELTVEASNPIGALTPNNLRVICAEHHQLGSERLVAREIIARGVRRL